MCVRLCVCASMCVCVCLCVCVVACVVSTSLGVTWCVSAAVFKLYALVCLCVHSECVREKE